MNGFEAERNCEVAELEASANWSKDKTRRLAEYPGVQRTGASAGSQYRQ